MAEPNYAQITVTEIDGGFIQYDIIPHDQTQEGAIALLDQNGVLSIRDEDGLYQPIAGTETTDIYEYSEPEGETPNFFPLEGVQTFSDLQNSVEIALSRNENGSLIVEVSIEDEVRSQFVGAVPAENAGFEQKTLIHDSQIGVIESETSPGGMDPQDVPLQFKI